MEDAIISFSANDALCILLVISSNEKALNTNICKDAAENKQDAVAG